MPVKIAQSLELQNAVPARVVGIGASAGGINSLEKFCQGLEHSPNSRFCAFVVIQHLPPDQPSVMSEILARQTNLPVMVAEHDMKLVSGTIYIAPPDSMVSLLGYRFQLTERAGSPNQYRSIDFLFKSLAANFLDAATGIVLSGTGTDGAIGLTDIYLGGGVTMVESPASAKFDGMPNAAIATGCVSHIAEISEMHQHVGDERNFQALEGTLWPQSPLAIEAFDKICRLLSEYFEFDLTGYKTPTIYRRIARRASIERITEISEYAQVLSDDEQKLDELYQDVLIGVTDFFRDEYVFAEMRKAIRNSLANLPVNYEYRVWVAGCSTGEEAYSVGMTVLEVAEELGRSQTVKILATDISEKSVERAAIGDYAHSKVTGISNELLKKYFDKQTNGGYRVSARLRRHFVFSRHDLIGQPPFTKIDLATCRNVLIYFKEEAQKQSISNLWFSLNLGGTLVLGPSETLGANEAAFDTVCHQSRIFRKHGRSEAIVNPLVATTLARENSSILYQPATGTTGGIPDNKRLLDTYAKSVQANCHLGFIVDERQRLVEFFGDRTLICDDRVIRKEDELLEFLDPNLRPQVRESFDYTREHMGHLWSLGDTQISSVHPEDRYRVTVWSICGLHADVIGWFVDFRRQNEQLLEPPSTEHEERIWKLDADLKFTRGNLNAVVEALATSNEELRATNEEMVASNEELQSTNEELQSVNEELHSVNEAHQRKIIELQHVSNDLDKLLAASDIGAVLLDSELQIRRFTSSITRHFSLVKSDIGRPLLHFRNRLAIEDFENILVDAISTGAGHTVRTIDDYGEGVFLKLVPLHENEGNQISGLLLNIVHQSFADADEPLTVTYGEIGTWEWPNTGADEMWWSPSCYRLLGMADNSLEPTFENWKALIHPDDLGNLAGLGKPACQFASNGFIVLRMKTQHGEYKRFDFRGLVKLSRDGNVQSMSGTISRSRMIHRYVRKT